MKKVIIRFIGTGYNDNYQAKVKIYDKCYNLIFDGCTYNGKVKICLKENKTYIIKAILGNKVISTVICINRCNNYFEYAFYNCFIKRNNRDDNNVTFLLTDYFYDNLPIERGNLILNG